MTPGAPIVILLADDDDDDRMMTRKAFEKHRLANDFYTVNDGEELMQFLLRQPPYQDAPRPGLILLDLNMPRMDGREAIKAIKAIEALRGIPIVVLTTSSEETDVVRTYDLGATSYITKPVGFDSLVQIVETLGRYWFQIVTLPQAG